jgi:hypothetical protein
MNDDVTRPRRTPPMPWPPGAGPARPLAKEEKLPKPGTGPYYPSGFSFPPGYNQPGRRR